MCTSANPSRPTTFRADRSLRPAGIRRFSKAVVCALAIAVATPSVSFAQEPPRSAWAEGGLGLAAVVTSLFYSSAKLLYAGAGTLTGGLAFALTGGRKDVVAIIVNPAIRGDYIVTPANFLERRMPVFFGPYPEDLQEYPGTAAGEEPRDGGAGSAEPAPYPF
jgi:hypothetical protein